MADTRTRDVGATLALLNMGPSSNVW